MKIKGSCRHRCKEATLRKENRSTQVFKKLIFLFNAMMFIDLNGIKKERGTKRKSATLVHQDEYYR